MEDYEIDESDVFDFDFIMLQAGEPDDGLSDDNAADAEVKGVYNAADEERAKLERNAISCPAQADEYEDEANDA
eukprot:IDg19542t1